MYRASRDGFGVTDFHSKCDNQPNTVTFIKTTSGWVFGGYTQTGNTVSNGSIGNNVQFLTDSKAFLFSLVNKLNKPFLCNIRDESKAIAYCSLYGPTFGCFDIHIVNNSNNSTESYAELTSYQNPNDINDPSRYYFCEKRKFQTKEIEVFQINNI